ncbi:MAG: hypothetical protein ACJAVK_000141, partial [Akkermansiaceae bacterium]
MPSVYHPHVLAADGLFTPDGRFHCMPAEEHPEGGPARGERSESIPPPPSL